MKREKDGEREGEKRKRDTKGVIEKHKRGDRETQRGREKERGGERRKE